MFNVGGGRERSVSLIELTRMCRERTGQAISLAAHADTSNADIPYYVTDNSQITAAGGWQPRRALGNLLDDIFVWLRDNRAMLEPILGVPADAMPAPSVTTC